MSIDRFLAEATDRGGLDSEDLVAAVLPAFRTVAEWHHQGFVAPLRGLGSIEVVEPGILTIVGEPSPPRRNRRAVDEAMASASAAFDVVGQARRTIDVDERTHTDESLDVAAPGDPVDHPVLVTGYETWEHQLDHHDELVDIESLGLLLASLAFGLDLRDRDNVELLAGNRRNLFALRGSVHPVIARIVGEMIELDRHQRAQDLPSLVERLETYRDQPVDFDLDRVEGAEAGPLTTRRTAIQAALRDRLFEINRRNRLIYFKPTQQSVNLTLGSVPLLLDVRSLTPDHVATWTPALAEKVLSGSSISLSSLLRFEDSPYLPGVLDKVISEARRHRTEYGMAQLRLVVCFLRWHNLKEVKAERIDSPLLLLPIEITRKRGVRDSYVMKATSTVAEVNPALRHHLRQLYDLELPESVDLADEGIDDLHQRLDAQIQASEPGVVLTKVDRPRLEIIHQRAQVRVDQYRKRQRAARVAESRPTSYSYAPGDRRPLGIQLFDARVRYQHPPALRTMVGAAPTARAPQMASAPVVTEKQTYALQEGGPANPYRWELDLCSLTVANFNHRKMTLVRDYTQLIETNEPNDAFDRLFSLDARPAEVDDAGDLPLGDRHLVVPADQTQRAALSRARLGRSFIIQGPPGTGKSQTITNLIADHIARGRTVLFVCEKRAALDVVHARLRAMGLDEICALIHDSQADKRDFIRGMRTTYEAWLGAADDADDAARDRTRLIEAIEGHLAAIDRFDTAMTELPEGSSCDVRRVIERSLELPVPASDAAVDLGAAVPTVDEWDAAAPIVHRIGATLERLGEPPVLARHPVSDLDASVAAADRPVDELVARSSHLIEVLGALDPWLAPLGTTSASLRPADLDGLLVLAAATAELAPQARPALVPGSPAAASLDQHAAHLAAVRQAQADAHARTVGWSDPLSPEDTAAGLVIATAHESSPLRIVNGSWRRLRKAVAARYDLSGHAVRPTVEVLLTELSARHRADAEAVAAVDGARWFGPGDLVSIVTSVAQVHALDRPEAVRLREAIGAGDGDAEPLAAALLASVPAIAAARSAIGALLAASERPLDELLAQSRTLLGTAGTLHELLADLRHLDAEHPGVAAVVRTVGLVPDDIERQVLTATLDRFGARNADVERFSGLALADHLAGLRDAQDQLLAANARSMRAGVRAAFLERVAVSGASASTLDPAGKELKKRYARGRRELEHEFAKTMRYRSIRDLAEGDTGAVVMDLRPIWLMSPLSVSDTLPLDPGLFDVVVFDEASQIPLEEAVPALYRSHQSIVVGDQMQLPPTQFFSTSTTEEIDAVDDADGRRVGITLDGDSFLAQSATTLPSTMLAWHYRSRSEDLIAFSNVAFYGGALATVPDRHRPADGLGPVVADGPPDGDAAADALLARNVSFHLLPNGIYEGRRNVAEAAYIAELVRSLLLRGDQQTIGIAAFSEAQQGEIELALDRLSAQDPEFAVRLDEEERREDDGQFVGLFVKNLENIQGDERDIIVMSVCYGPGPDGRMLMSFGPINQRGGEKRLNVIFSRARRHMAIVSSIRSERITNVHNDGANTLRRFLAYAEALSGGEADLAESVLAQVDPLHASTRAHMAPSVVVRELAEVLRAEGLHVEIDHGRSRFRCDLVVSPAGAQHHQVAVLVDTARRAAMAPVEERSITHPSVLRGFGWSVVHVVTRDWLRQPDAVVRSVQLALQIPPGP